MDNRTFSIKFDSSSHNFGNVKFKKSKNEMKPKFEPSSEDKDIYYDYIIDYDGGGVEGYGYN